MVVEGVAAEGEQDLVPPASVAGGRRVEEDGDQGPDVLDASGLEVELGDHGVGRVVPGSRSSGRGLVGGRGAGLGDDGLAGGDAEEVLRLGDPESESIGHALHPPAVLTNEEAPLHEGAEGGVELEGAVLGVAEELPLERHPGLSRCAAVGPDEVLKI